MKRFLQTILIIPFLLVAGCSTYEKTGWSVLARGGFNSGGIVENRELDAISGATGKGFSAGVHALGEFSGRQFETGLDYLAYEQIIRYNDPESVVKGEKKITYGELRLPVTYNFRFLKNLNDYPFMTFKLGVNAGYVIDTRIEHTGNTPDHSIRNFSAGPTIGLVLTPLKIKNHMRLGAYIDLYRGSKIYTDPYHTGGKSGNTSFLNAGLQLHFGSGL